MTERYLNDRLDSATIILSPGSFLKTHSRLLVHTLAISMYVNVLHSFIFASRFNLIIVLRVSLMFIERICYVMSCYVM